MDDSTLDQEGIDQAARKIMIEQGLLDPKDFEGLEDEDAARQTAMRVDDYTEDEIQEDINIVDWDFAYSEILKLEERKKDLYTKEADKKLQEEKLKIEE